MRLRTLISCTPATPWVSWMARCRSCSLATEPLKLTTPREVSTLIAEARTSGSAASLAFTWIVMLASSGVSYPVLAAHPTSSGTASTTAACALQRFARRIDPASSQSPSAPASGWALHVRGPKRLRDPDRPQGAVLAIAGSRPHVASGRAHGPITERPRWPRGHLRASRGPQESDAEKDDTSSGHDFLAFPILVFSKHLYIFPASTP